MTDSTETKLRISNKGCRKHCMPGNCHCPEGSCWYDEATEAQEKGLPIPDPGVYTTRAKDTHQKNALKVYLKLESIVLNENEDEFFVDYVYGQMDRLWNSMPEEDRYFIKSRKLPMCSKEKIRIYEKFLHALNATWVTGNKEMENKLLQNAYAWSAAHRGEYTEEELEENIEQATLALLKERE